LQEKNAPAVYFFRRHHRHARHATQLASPVRRGRGVRDVAARGGRGAAARRRVAARRGRLAGAARGGRPVAGMSPARRVSSARPSPARRRSA
jgi:hypothetical protein